MNSQRVGVVGLGLLGRGITACFLGHGFEAVAFARHEQTHTSVREHIEQMMDELVDLGGFDAGIRQSWLARYFPATDYPALRDCSFVVESVVEDIATKHEVFDRIESEVGAAAIIASNSSAIPITQLQKRRQHPERFLAMHWAEPAHATRFLEIIRGEKTSEATIQTTLSLARRLGKEPSLLQKEIPGFIANRIGYAMYREALSLLESGVADAETMIARCGTRSDFGRRSAVLALDGPHRRAGALRQSHPARPPHAEQLHGTPTGHAKARRDGRPRHHQRSRFL